MPVIEVNNLCHIYGKKTPFETCAIDNISFTLNKGETLGIIGSTGSGKSTLVQHLNGLIEPDSGEIKYLGENIWSGGKCRKGLRFEVGLVFQYPEYQLFEDTVKKDIAFGPTNMELSEQEIEQRVLSAAAAVGLKEELLLKSPFDLSGGEKRRAAIAGIMAMQPQVLVLDEPTAGLDPAGRRTIEKAINEYKSLNDASVIIVSHSMEEICRLCDKVLVISKGKRIMFDTVKNVFLRSDELKSIGLNVPEITEICALLNKGGMDVPVDIFRIDDAVLAIERALKGGEQL
ncbi:MAG: energy-coupling factor transporter ATPase [Clostridia bacterium]|nr:energy-coupling factor transporter ATPase [Clostridia bacterium]